MLDILLWRESTYTNYSEWTIPTSVLQNLYIIIYTEKAKDDEIWKKNYVKIRTEKLGRNDFDLVTWYIKLRKTVGFCAKTSIVQK